MRKTTKAQIEADERLIQKAEAVQEYIKKQQRYMEQKKEELKADIDRTFANAITELGVMGAEWAALEAELRGTPAETEKPKDEDHKPDEGQQGDGQAEGKVASIGARRK